MSTFYASAGISSGDIGGAIAYIALDDIRTNGLGLQGFPQIAVKKLNTDEFLVTLCFEGNQAHFNIPLKMAVSAIAAMKENNAYSADIFNLVHISLASLEHDAGPH